MKYLASYNKFFEDGEGGGDSSSGMGAVVSAQPGALPGQTGTTGSGDVSFVFKKDRGKKGNPSDVSDLRDLDDADEMEKIDEIYSKQDIFSEVLDNLKQKNLSPITINKIMDSYTDMISDMYDKGINTTQIVDKVMSLVDGGGDKNHIGFQSPNVSTRNLTYL